MAGLGIKTAWRGDVNIRGFKSGDVCNFKRERY